MKRKLQTKKGQPSWRLAAGPMKLFVTQTRGHVAR